MQLGGEDQVVLGLSKEEEYTLPPNQLCARDVVCMRDGGASYHSPIVQLPTNDAGAELIGGPRRCVADAHFHKGENQLSAPCRRDGGTYGVAAMQPKVRCAWIHRGWPKRPEHTVWISSCLGPS